MQIAILSLLLLWAGEATSAATKPADWPQFRGPGSLGVADGASLPAEVGPEKNVHWKIELPPGHSSPIVAGGRIFVTAVRGERLLTIGLDAATGRTLWEIEAPHRALEKIHRIGSHAQPTPATDGQRVVSFFGSSGLFCYDIDGKLLWDRPMGPFNNDFGAGTSPIIVGDRVILCQDHDTDSFLMSLDKQTGKVLWRTDRSEFPRNYCTPIIWEVAGKKQIVVAATLRVVGYDFDSGEELWTVRGISRTVCMTPVVAPDGTLVVAGWAAGGDAGEAIRVEPFDTVAPMLDENKNGNLEENELPEGPIKQRYSQVDRDKSGGVTRMEYEFFRSLFDQGKNLVLAMKPGGTGDLTNTNILWQTSKLIPFCASPLVYENKVFLVKDGGIFSCLNLANGKPLKQKRLEATGEYYSSPVAGDGKVYLSSVEGQVTVLDAQKNGEVLFSAPFGEEIYATPAIAGGRIYLRTVGHLYCLGKAE